MNDYTARLDARDERDAEYERLDNAEPDSEPVDTDSIPF